MATSAPFAGVAYNRRSVASEAGSATAAVIRLCATDDGTVPYPAIAAAACSTPIRA